MVSIDVVLNSSLMYSILHIFYKAGLSVTNTITSTTIPLDKSLLLHYREHYYNAVSFKSFRFGIRDRFVRLYVCPFCPLLEGIWSGYGAPSLALLFTGETCQLGSIWPGIWSVVLLFDWDSCRMLLLVDP